jgi:hypothetical protein
VNFLQGYLTSVNLGIGWILDGGIGEISGFLGSIEPRNKERGDKDDKGCPARVN